MRKLIALTAALALSGCAHMDTPRDKYYATASFVKATGEVAEIYVDACRKEAADAPCRKKFPAINTGAKTMKTAMAEANKVFVTKDSPYLDLSLTTAQNAAMNLRNLLGE